MKTPCARLIVTASYLVLAACSREPAPTNQSQAPAVAEAPKAAIGAWGLDTAGMDTSVKPGDDFFKYANGGWMANNQIPPDLSSWGSFTKLAVDTEVQIHGILESLPADAAAGTPEQKVRDFYRSYLDVEAIERAGSAPARAALDEIAAAKTHADIARLMGRPDLGLETPIYVGITIDEKDPNRYVVGMGQSGLGLPERDYYLKKDQSLAQTREKYLAHIARMLSLLDPKDSERRAKTILDAETKIAKRHWEIAKRRDRDLTYNVKKRSELQAMAKNYPWKEFLDASGLQEQNEFIVAELDAVQGLAGDFTKIPVDTWKNYLTYHYLVAHASVLPRAFDEELFSFYGKTLNGQPQQRERWKRAVQTLDNSIGEVVGQIYVKQYFPPQSKAQMLELVENLRAAYKKRIQGLSWMSEETKKVALEKLDTFRPKIGYPDKWKDYSALEVRAGDAFGNTVRARVFGWQDDLKRLGRPTDKDEWFLPPQTVNAYYNPSYNEIVFPAAILQPPYFDPNADAAINYGGIGGVIGHEMGHGFDDQGAKSDAYGVLRTWWQPKDESEFKKLVDALVKQYDGYEAMPGLNLNGKLTAGENIGDLGGVTIAYEAYQMHLKGQPAPVLDGYTGDQRFFLSWAQVWRTLQRDERLRRQVLSDPHSPGLFRVQGVVRNIDQWYDAFNVTPADKLYLAPEQRVYIW